MTPEDKEAFEAAWEKALKENDTLVNRDDFEAGWKVCRNAQIESLQTAIDLRDQQIESFKLELSKWMLLSDQAKKGLENRAQLIAAKYENESLSTVNQQMLEALRLALDALNVLLPKNCDPHYSVVVIKMRAAIAAVDTLKVIS